VTDLAINLIKVASVAIIYLFLLLAGRTMNRHLSAAAETSTRRSAAAVPTLILRTPRTEARTVEVRRPVVVGRSPEADVTLEGDEFASGRHARFHVSEGRLYVEDLGSTNGTQVNGHLVPGRADLSPGDTVQIGETLVEIG